MARLRRRGDPPLQNAFTLLELLVVITVLAIVASWLLPGLSRARAAARSIKCRSNLRQIGLGLKLYVDDQGARYPFYTLFDSKENRVPTVWFDLLSPYVHDRWLNTNGVFKCPDYRWQTRGAYWDAVNAIPLDANGSYGYNCKRSFG